MVEGNKYLVFLYVGGSDDGTAAGDGGCRRRCRSNVRKKNRTWTRNNIES